MTPPPTSTSRRAFTLLEMLIVITIIATIAALVIPSFNDDSRLRLMAASSVITSDIELAQVMTISQPDQPMVVRFEPDHHRYHLARASDPATPINREDTGEPYRVTLGQGRASTAEGVTFTTAEIPDNTLAFNPQGGVDDFTTSPRITLSLAGRTITLDISASTGSITETAAP